MSTFTLSLQHQASKVEQGDALPSLIQRIHEQRGHFRNISEQGLLEEIRAAEAGETDEGSEQDDSQDAGQDFTARREEIYKTKDEMRRYIAQAQNDALTALDFISLLLSKDKPLQGGASMSPALKQMVPAGSLGFEKYQPPKLDKADKTRQEDTLLGWTFESLDSAADRLLQSASRLEQEMEREAKYWSQVLSVSKRGWALCRMPRERHTIGVRFGFAEASPAFQARDLAALRPDATGAIVLDQGLANQPKAIRVQLKQGNGITASSFLPSIANNAAAYDLEAYIRRARDSLFEEELFHELTREARNLLPYGVRVRNSVVSMPLPSSATSTAAAAPQPSELQITLVPLSSPAPPTADHPLPTTAALALRLLLTHAHTLHHRARTQPPAPLAPAAATTTSTPSPPPPALLRPLLAHAAHHAALAALQDLLHTLQPAEKAAHVATTHASLPALDAAGQTSGTAMQALLGALSGPLRSAVSAPCVVRRSGSGGGARQRAVEGVPWRAELVVSVATSGGEGGVVGRTVFEVRVVVRGSGEEEEEVLGGEFEGVGEVGEFLGGLGVVLGGGDEDGLDGAAEAKVVDEGEEVEMGDGGELAEGEAAGEAEAANEADGDVDMADGDGGGVEELQVDMQDGVEGAAAEGEAMEEGDADGSA